MDGEKISRIIPFYHITCRSIALGGELLQNVYTPVIVAVDYQYPVSMAETWLLTVDLFLRGYPRAK